MKDMPSNSHFIFDILLSMDNVDYQFGNYLSHNFTTYIVLQKGTDPEYFINPFRDIFNKYVLPQAQAFMDIKTMDEFEKTGNRLEYHLMPMTKIHLYSASFPGAVCQW